VDPDDVCRIIGEEKALSVKVGAEANDPSTEDVILVRGASAEVDRAVKEILKIVEDAKNDLILSSYVCPVHNCCVGVELTRIHIKLVEFEIDREYVGRVVGSQGSGVNRLRESLGVKIDFSDDGDDIKDAGRKKKGTSQRSKITVRNSSPLTHLE
jgi:transcription antitermination factor NusA-like protein